MNKDDNLTVYLSTIWMYRKLKGFFPICTLFIISLPFYLIARFFLSRPMSNSISNVSVKFSISCIIFMEIISESCFLLFFSISKIGHVSMKMSWQRWTFAENWWKKFQIWGPHFWSFWPLRFSSIWPENGLFRKDRPHENSKNFSPWPHFARNWPKLTEMDFCWKLMKKVPNLGTPFLVILAPQIFFNLAWKRTFS